MPRILKYMKMKAIGGWMRHLAVLSVALAFGGIGIIAQNSLPAPGSGGSLGGGNSMPAPGSGGSFNPAPPNGIGWNPGPPSPANWGSPWNPGWNSYTGPIIVNTPLSSPNWQNTGVTNVVACGYDAMGVWRTIPLNVSYDYNGVQYDVTVMNAWDPWTQMWNTDVDVPAVNTSYYLRGNTFDFYVVLSTGTYYFNL